MKSSPLNIQSLGKALRVLEVFHASNEAEIDLSLMDIVRLSGFDKSTVQRITYTLQLNGYLMKNPATKRYSLGMKVLDLTFDFLRNNSFLEMANPHLIDLCRITGERVNLSLYDRTTLVYAVRHQTRPDYYFSTLIGRRIPTVYSAGGRAILAGLPMNEVESIVSDSDFPPYTARTVTDRDQIMEEIERIRKDGYGKSAEEITYGEVGLGAAIVDKAGKPIAALHIIGTLSSWTLEGFATKYSSQLLETVQRISGR